MHLIIEEEVAIDAMCNQLLSYSGYSTSPRMVDIKTSKFTGGPASCLPGFGAKWRGDVATIITSIEPLVDLTTWSDNEV